jgi:hypothetical protein
MRGRRQREGLQVQEVPTEGGEVTAAYRVEVPFAGEWLTSNKAGRYRHGSTPWRHTAHMACRAAKLPTGLTPVILHLVAYYVGRAPVRDNANLYPTIKAIVDGLTPLKVSSRHGQRHTRGGYGLIPDDSDKHIRDLSWRLERSTTERPYVVLTVLHVPPTVDNPVDAAINVCVVDETCGGAS